MDMLGKFAQHKCVYYTLKKKSINQKCLLKLFVIDCYIISQFPRQTKGACAIFLGHPWTVRVQRTFNVHQQTSFQVVSLLPCGMKQLTGLKKSKVFWFETSRNRKNATNAWYNTHRYTTCKWLVRRFFFDEGTLYRLCVLRIVCTDAQQKKIYEQWKKGPWLFRVYRG